MSEEVLTIRNLNIHFDTRCGQVNVVDHIDLSIKENETLCIVGESGCGKSVLAVSVLGLLPENAVVTGSIKYRGKELLNHADTSFRGKKIAMIFEQPMSCLNPVMSVGSQIAESITENLGYSKKAARADAMSILNDVGIPVSRFDAYPHQFSGGMQQRAMIAMALACRPSLLIADEPTTSLDLTVQYQILELLERVKEEYKLAMLMITHDLSVVAEMADKVAVMYAGTLLEVSPVLDFFKSPLHPYSKALLSVVSGNRLRPIAGSVPNLTEKRSGCPFVTRCSQCASICETSNPKPVFINNRMEKCHLAGTDTGAKPDKNIQHRKRASVPVSY